MALFLALLLTACGTPKITKPDPTPLTVIDESVQLSASWSTSEVRTAAKKNSGFVALRPNLEANLLIAASPDGHVLAFDRESQVGAWRRELGHRIASGVGAGGGVAVVVSSSGMVHALSSADGSEIWESQLSELVFAPPLIYRERVVLRTIDGNLIALSVSDGTFLWDAIYDQPEFLEFGSAVPAVYENAVIIGNATGRVIATDLTSGFELWQLYLGSDRSAEILRSREANPKLFGNHLILSDESRAIVTYDLSTGNVKWERRLRSGRNLAVDRSAVYGHDADSLVFAFNLSNGADRWQQNSFLYRGIDEMAIVGERLLVADALGYLHVLDQGTGAVIGRYHARDRVAKDGLLVDGDRVFVTYRSGRLEALTLNAVQ